MRKLWQMILCISIFKLAAMANAQSDLTINSFSPYAGQTNIILQAGDDILFTGGQLILPNVATGQLTVIAGNSITVDIGTSIIAGSGWNITMIAGTDFSGIVSPGNGGIYLDGSTTQKSAIQTQNGNINLWATNEVQVGWSGSSAGPGAANAGSSSITTVNGGNISVTTVYGDVNTGSDPAGFDYHATTPYNTVDANLGGISTAAGGTVTIAAGGNVISYLPSGNTTTAEEDGGTGAFGPQAGNVNITAAANVYGHYIVANGAGSITAGQNVGAATGDAFALSLINGGWSVNATNGNIFLEEVRNPNGDFNNTTGLRGAHPGEYLFNYGPQAYVDLTANGVYLTDFNVPRLSTATIQVLYPPILNITAGSGSVTLEGNVTLFPSPDQSLDIATTNGGDFSGTGNNGTPNELLMSDSASSQWTSAHSFSDSDHGSLANEPNDSNPVTINISGSMEDLALITTKETKITVAGSTLNCGFSGQNLQSSDVTSINVVGQIYNTSAFSFVDLSQDITNIPPGDLLPGETNSWDAIFTLAVNPSLLSAEVTNLENQGVPVSQWAADILLAAGVFSDQNINGQVTGSNPGFIYNPSAGQLGFDGPMSPSVLSVLSSPITILHLVNGVAVIDPSTGQLETDTITWVSASALQTLYTESQGDPLSSNRQLGYCVGGPGQFGVTAGSISLGNCKGILSGGVYDPSGLARYSNLVSITPEGVTINVAVASNLDLSLSAIASLDGGDVNVIDTGESLEIGLWGFDLSALANAPAPAGIYTSGGGNVYVFALGNVDVANSSIATYDGGNIFIESEEGNVNVGSSAGNLNTIESAFVNPGTGQAAEYQEFIAGDGIMAETLVPPSAGEAFPPDAATVPGNITIETPEGNIGIGSAGITQASPGGIVPAGPTVTLTAGTPSCGCSQNFIGNIVLGNYELIGGKLILNATGEVTGPSLTASISQSAGSFVISWTASNVQLDTSDAGYFEIESSPDLFNWQVINPAVTATANGGLSFESSATTNVSCFYRVRWR